MQTISRRWAEHECDKQKSRCLAALPKKQGLCVAKRRRPSAQHKKESCGKGSILQRYEAREDPRRAPHTFKLNKIQRAKPRCGRKTDIERRVRQVHSNKLRGALRVVVVSELYDEGVA